MKILLNKIKCFPDVVSGAIIIIVALIFYSQTGKIKMFTALSDSVGPRFFPRLVLIILMILAAILIIGGIFSGKKKLIELTKAPAQEPKKQKSEGSTFPRMMTAVETNPRVRMWVSVFGIFFFILLMIPLGFAISGAIYLFLQFVLLSPRDTRKIWLYALIATVMAFCAYAVFRYAVGINLPAGLLKHIFP